MIDTEKTYDFSCWVIKYGGKSIHYGRTYKQNSLINSDGMIVPLLWHHQHDDPSFVLGYAVLENRLDGVYAYCTLYDRGDIANEVRRLIQNRGYISLSPFIVNVETDADIIVHGRIREVSLVFARIDPDEAYYPVLNE